MKQIVKFPLALTAVVLILFVVEWILPWDWSWLGIRPRSLTGLPGVITSPFLHADWKHLIANIFPLLVMGVLVSALAPTLFWERSGLLILWSGIGTWLISSSDVVIGASGLIFAYWSFLLSNGILRKRVKDILIAIATMFAYGGLFFSLFQWREGVSWAGHFSGVLAGVGVSYAQSKRKMRE